jgi:four helix bundle protein
MSISMNIVGGSARSTNKEFAHFLSISFGSASELEYQLLVARDLKFLSKDKYQRLAPRCAELKRMLTRLMEKVREPQAAATASGL